MFDKNDGTGYIKLSGTLTTDKTYSINRIINFKNSKIDDAGNIKTQVVLVTKATNDDISDTLFQDYFNAFSLDAVSYTQVSKISEDKFLFSSSFGPYFICEKQNENELPAIW